ncbi:hypothetical protein O6H91_07G050100 [Diphasiastrum complanatum]|uniref:Uncharacterized protein n=2 Tax=Diphasiastrum complanatum TaxID=34168 RepID=A0ACC2D565_DIPCM|nr:hypothetical protein O6H91_07G050100 [Diphasiastrum complanatum]KAJ7549361.1 hypothetical protein O6H91_07G050100 [Diphasiastrum complanatum]
MVWDSGSRLGGKRIRTEDDEVYLDNYHANKRYITEVISSSLNGLRVGDSVPDLAEPSQPGNDSLEIPNRFESRCPSKDELLDSPMSDDSDDNSQDRLIRDNEIPRQTPISVSDSTCGSPASPFSPEKLNSANQMPGTAHKTLHRSYSFPNISSAGFSCSLPKYQTDSDGRLPPSPSDSFQPEDLRRAALLRALQMRALSPEGLPLGLGAEKHEEATVHSSVEHDEHISSNIFLTNHEVAFEQTDDLGSPVHGIFTGSIARDSTRASRSLHLND